VTLQSGEGIAEVRGREERSMDDIESMCRGFLQNAAARHQAVARVVPDAPTADYLTGYGDGWEAGHVAALALVVAMMSGESMTGLIEEAGAQAAVESAFPFDVVVHLVDEEDDSSPSKAA
jgi:hypothetical protein